MDNKSYLHTIQPPRFTHAPDGIVRAPHYRKKTSARALREIIVVDDDELSCILYKRILEKELTVSLNFKQNGLEGYDFILQEKPDLVILDLMLPGMNGFDVLRKIRTEPTLQGTKVIIISAKSCSNDIERGFNLRADEYLTKPFQPKELLIRVRKLL